MTEIVPTVYTVDAAIATATCAREPPRVAGSRSNTASVLAATGHVGRPLAASTTAAPLAAASDVA